MNTTNGITYSAIIPDSIVKSPGVDYYISATDGIVSSDDPAIDANNSPYQIAVIPNIAPAIEHIPLTEALFDENIVIRATVTDNTNNLTAVELYYRKTGQLVFTKLAMTSIGNNIYEGVISNTFSTNENVEYYIKATDDYSVSSYASWPDNPYVISLKNAVGLRRINGQTVPDIFPNPVRNNNFVIRYNTHKNIDKFIVTIYTATGLKISELYTGRMPAGDNSIPIILKGIKNGIYFIAINAGSEVCYSKLIVDNI